MSEYRHPLARVLGLGSARRGTEHWWIQRLTSVALIPLTVWFIVSLLSVIGASEMEARMWLAHPLTAVPMILFIFVGFYHLKMGASEIVTDYVHQPAFLVGAQILITFACFGIGAAAIFSVLKIAFTS